jgi:hypothetical protein
MRKVRRLTTAAAATIASLVLAVMPVAGQTPHLPDGKPNLNGIWQAMNTANWDLLDHGAQPALVVASGAIGAEPGGPGVVEGGMIPYRPEALAQKKQNYENRATADPEVKCYLPGVPRATYMPYPFQIFQSTTAMSIAYEYDNAYRNIYLKDPGPAPADSWMGQSVGHWEGNTLVVEVTGLFEGSWFDRAGDFHSDALHVIERYTLTGPNTINYEATIDDNKVFTKPWKISMPLYRHIEKDARLVDFKCVEFVEQMLYGQFTKKKSK